VAQRLAYRQVIRLVAGAVVVGVSLLAAAPVQAAFPGANGKIAFERFAPSTPGNRMIYSVNPDGSGTTQLTAGNDVEARWSPDGGKLLFARLSAPGGTGYYIQDPVGTPAHFVHTGFGGGWSPDGTRLSFGTGAVGTMNVDGSDLKAFTLGWTAEWSPDGEKIAFSRDRCADPPSCEFFTDDLWTMNADGSGETKLVDDASPLDWSPDGSKLLYSDYTLGVSTINRDGTDRQPFPVAGAKAWSPDGTKVVGVKASPSDPSTDLFTANIDGTGVTPLTSTPDFDDYPDWQPLPGSSPAPTYETPKLAAPIHASLVPVFRQCGTGANPTDGQHSPPLGTAACLPPQAQGVAHFGPQGKGTAWVSVIYGDTNALNGDQADATLRFDLSDIQTAGGADYNPNPSGSDGTLVTRLRFTDRANGPSGTNAGTATDLDFPVPFNCTPTSDPSLGSTCALDTSADAVNPGAIKENNATVLQVFRMRLNDSGPNGVRGDSDDRLFATEGIYIP
jgi:hypothetical protein